MATSCEDEDLTLALALQNELSSSCSVGNTNNTRKRNRSTSVVDECWETIDPTPDIRQLFMEFNDTYFEGKLAGCEVKWSPRMTLCAGLCCYEGRGGLCSIKLSLPLLKLRPRRDLVQTLLHEMIHALLFVTHNNKDHDAHGPEFHKHMYCINKQSGANITVYHNFHDEVDLYRQHWWQCNGPCQKRPPYYGFVKRAMNRAPSPRDPWWSDHQQNCGGTYTKVKEPEDYQKKKRKMKDESNDVSGKNVSSDSGMPKIYDLWKKEGSSGVLSTSDKENSLQKSNIESVSAVTPFSGKGYVLGSLKKGNPTDTGSYLGSSLKNNRIFLFTPYENRDKKVVEVKDDSPIQSNRSGEMILRTDEGNLALRKDIDQSICGQKTDTAGKIKNKRRPGNHSELTIIDAFKRVEKVDRKTPVVILDDSPGKHLHSPINLNLVPCPVCLINVQENLINSHLDSCLL